MRKNWTKMRRDRRADIGIGTMIVFIAMVLVAAVAAAVLISTANQVREQATSTGDQAINNVAAGFVKVGVVARAETTVSPLMDEVNVFLRLAAGSPDIFMGNVVVKAIADGATLTYTQATPLTYTYKLEKELGVANFGTALSITNGVVEQGDLLNITITGILHLGPMETMEIIITPAFGQSTFISFIAPETLIDERSYTVG